LSIITCLSVESIISKIEQLSIITCLGVGNGFDVKWSNVETNNFVLSLMSMALIQYGVMFYFSLSFPTIYLV
jgi:hypothetical protein